MIIVSTGTKLTERGFTGWSESVAAILRLSPRAQVGAVWDRRRGDARYISADPKHSRRQGCIGQSGQQPAYGIAGRLSRRDQLPEFIDLPLQIGDLLLLLDGPAILLRDQLLL